MIFEKWVFQDLTNRRSTGRLIWKKWENQFFHLVTNRLTSLLVEYLKELVRISLDYQAIPIILLICSTADRKRFVAHSVKYTPYVKHINQGALIRSTFFNFRGHLLFRATICLMHSRLTSGSRHRSWQAKVNNLDFVRFRVYQNIVQLDVSVNQSCIMNSLESVQKLL